MNTPQVDPELERLRTAAHWLVRLRETGDDEALISEWLAWCEASPENFDAFERIEDSWQLAGSAAVLPAPRPQPTRGRWWRRVSTRAAVRALAAALVIVAGLLLLQPQWPHGGQTLSTPVAIHGSSLLPDGSRVELGAHSRITTRFEDDVRRVVIESGEAYFEVAHDKTRPFVVEADALTVTAVGTAFNVRRGDERVVVTVAEGRVRLASNEQLAARTDTAGGSTKRVQAKPVEAGAGEQATFSAQDGRIDLALADPSVATSWRDGVLKFVHEPLDEVVSDLNRYSTRKIVLGDPALARLRYTGTVFGNRLEDWLNAVESVFPVQVTYEGPDRIVLVPRKPQPAAPSSKQDQG